MIIVPPFLKSDEETVRFFPGLTDEGRPPVRFEGPVPERLELSSDGFLTIRYKKIPEYLDVVTSEGRSGKLKIKKGANP